MRIIIKADGVRMRLWFPLSIIKSRIGYNTAKSSLERQARKYISKQSSQDLATENGKNLQVEVLADTQGQQEQIKQDIPKEVPISREMMVEAYNVLKRCVQLNGHFNIIEVDSHDGQKVIIRI